MCLLEHLVMVPLHPNGRSGLHDNRVFKKIRKNMITPQCLNFKTHDNLLLLIKVSSNGSLTSLWLPRVHDHCDFFKELKRV